MNRQLVTEIQGAAADGVRGIAYPERQKLTKYITVARQLMEQPVATQRQMQVVCSDLVYSSTFRRQFLGGSTCVGPSSNHSMSLGAAGYPSPPIPKGVKLEIRRSLCLIPLCRLNFRVNLKSMVACSDVSDHGGGVCVATGLANRGKPCNDSGTTDEELRGSKEPKRNKTTTR